MIPRYYITESLNGNVDICFDEVITKKFNKIVFEKIKEKITKLEKNERSLYHLEKIVNDVLFRLEKDGKIVKNKNNETGNKAKRCGATSVQKRRNFWKKNPKFYFK